MDSRSDDDAFLRRPISIQTYEDLHRTPQRNPISTFSNISSETTGYTSLDTFDGDFDSVSQNDGQRISLIQDMHLRPAQHESIYYADQGHLESMQSLEIDPENSHDLESTNAQDWRHSSSRSMDGLPEEAEPQTNRHPTWLSLYLQRLVFIFFAVFLGAMVVVLEVLFAISKKRQGLTESHAGLKYLWTYGPTALLTLIHALWNRVDYEAKVTTPWLRADPVFMTRDALLLDYIDMFPLAVPFRALRRRDFLVAATSTISLLLSVLIVLSTGLFTLSSVEIVDHLVPISLKSQFVDDPTRLINPSTLPFYGMQGLAEANLTYPDGYSDQYAYQSFASDLPGVSELRATVDGMSVGLDCVQAAAKDFRFGQIFWTTYGSYTWDSHFSLEYEDCNSTISFTATPFNALQPYTPSKNNRYAVFTQRYVYLFPIEGLTPGQCGSKGKDHKRLVFLSAELHFRLANETETTYYNNSGIALQIEVTDAQSSSLICAPNYGITLVDIVRNTTGVKSVSRHDGAPLRSFSDIHSWDIIQAHQDSFENLRPTEPLSMENTTIDSEATQVLKMCGNLCPQFSSLLNATLIEGVLNKYYQKYAAFLLQQSLMEPVDVASTATASRIVDRLLVQPMSCQWMVGIMVLAMILLAGLSLRSRRKMPCSIEPGSILATAALAGRLTASSFPSNLGETDTKTLEKRVNKWSNADGGYHPIVGTYSSSSGFPDEAERGRKTRGPPELTGSFKPVHPVVMQPIFRIAIYILIVSCVIILEVMLQRSTTYQGLGDVRDEMYLHYVWTILPAAIFSLLGLFFSSLDFQTRLLAPYHSLTHTAPINSSLNLNLLRPFIPQVIYQQFCNRSFGALATSMAALISSIFAISVGPLYQLRVFPVSSSVELRTTSTFSTGSDAGLDAGVVSSLILESNLSYTPLVYENLVFPEFSLEGYTTFNASQASRNSSTIINVTVPALRPQLSCRLYQDSDITTSLFHNKTIPPDGIGGREADGIAINVPGEACRERFVPGILELVPNSTATFTASLPTEGFFGTASNTKGHAASGCSYFVYTWGKFSSFTDPPSIWASALGCNVTVEAIDVLASFVGPQLQLDLSHPPQPIESTSKIISVNTNSSSIYSMSGIKPFILYSTLASLPPHSNDTIFDSFFEQLVTSRYGIPISAIGDPSQVEAVKDSIIFQHGVIAAQDYSTNYRVNVEASSNGINGSSKTFFPSLSNTSVNDTGVYSGTASDPYGRRRVVQDPTSTRVIEALLLGTLMLSLLSWGLSPRKAVLPRSPASIASVLAFLAGGDILEHMYKDGHSQWEKLEDVISAFPEDCKFWIGWRPPGVLKEETRQRFGIWVVKNEGESVLTRNDTTDREI
ncbi:hypothetical protein AAE478_009862 [Parahypoxylon ruwenzoriense]